MKALKGMSGIEKREREARNCEMEMKSARRNGHLARGKSIGSSSRRTKKKMSLNKYYSSFSASLPILLPSIIRHPSIAMECDFNKLIFEILELILSVLIFPPSLVFALSLFDVFTGNW